MSPRPRGEQGKRLTRVLAMLPWLLRTGDTTVAEISERFGIDEEEAVRDLGMLSMCGMPPYYAGDLIEVVVHDDGVVTVFDQGLFTQPLQLTPTEGFAVLAAGRALLATPGADDTGPLASALGKLEQALGGGLAVDIDAPEHLDAVRAAAAEHRTVAITYYSAWRDLVAERRIDPWLVHAADGRWYVEAFDHSSRERRRFRVDRIHDLSVTDDRFEPVAVDPPDTLFSRVDSRRVVLAVPRSARWIAETYDVVEQDDMEDGRLRLVLDVAGETWLERLLLRVGPEAEILEPADLGDLGSSAARRILENYR